ncbi:MAG: PAS domain S-box protein, partial [Desulfobacterales bacterium]|nr:PAS domain S-box protein [Desulfobacterales bacterium]
MKDQPKTKQELLEENAFLKQKIHELEQSESARKQESDEILHLITENMLDCVAFVDASGTYQYVTPSYRETLGYGSEDMVGITGFNLTHPDDLERILKLYMDGIEQGLSEIRYETRLRHKNSHYIPMEIRARSLKDTQGKIIGGVLAARDITKRLQVDEERKRSEEALQKSERRFRELAELLPETVYETDSQGTLTFVNRNAFDRFGYTQEDYEGGLNALDMIIPDDHDRALKNLQRIISGKNIGSIEYTVRRKVGSTFPAMIHTAAIIHDGKLAGLRGFIADITEQKRTEERLTRINACLLSLGSDFDENVARLTALCGELLGATCALYNRLESGMLCSTGQWHTPSDYAAKDKPDGHICYDVIRQGSDEVLVVHNLPQTPYAATDPNVTKYGLRTYFGQLVRCDGKPVGSLCVVFQRDVESTDDDKRIIGIIASSLTSEEGRKRVEDALRKNQRQLTDIIEFLPDATFAIDKQRRVIIWNKAIEKMTGVSASEMIGQGDYAYTIPFYGEARPQLMDLVFKHQDEIAARYPHIIREGDTLMTEVFCNALNDNKGAWVFAKASPLHDQAGNIIGAIEIIRDITERKRAEEALRKSEEKYRLIADNMADVIAVTDMNLRYTYVSPSAMRLSGFTVEEVMEQIPEQAMTIESARIIYKTFEEEMKLEASGKANPKRTRIMELEIYRKDGSTFSAELSLSFIRDTNQKPIGILSLTRDITERKRAEDALRESEKKYRLVLEANPDPMIVYDIEGKVIYLNPAFTSVFGWSLEERIGKKMDDFVPEESWPETRMMIDMVIAGKNFSGIETRRLTREGKMIPVSVSGSCYRNQEGNIEASVINLRDITESKRVEAEKKNLEEQYRQAQKMEAIGQLAGGVAHDFNNMLNIILGYSQLALINLEPSNPLNANLQEIMNASRHSSDLVRQLLAFARKQTIAPKVLDLNNTVAGMLNMLRRLLGEDIDLFWMPVSDLWPVKMDPAQIDQILANLAVNARDAISGVGKITIETGKAEFDKTYCETNIDFVPGQYILLAVSDNGCG